MAHVIEAAKSSRAACRTCKQKIEKGELRFGEEVANAFSGSGDTAYQWHHLACAAQKKPVFLRQALEAHKGDVPDRANLDKLIAENVTKQKPTTMPYAERAPTGRSTCMACQESIEKGQLRVAIEREIEGAAFGRPSAGYLHAVCAPKHVADPGLVGKLRQNSTSLKPEDWTEVEKLLAEGEAARD